MGIITNACLHTQMPIQSYLKLSGAICRYLELPGAIWSYLKLSGAIGSSLKLSGASLEASGIVSERLDRLGAV